MVGIESNQRPQKERKKRTGNMKIGKTKKKKKTNGYLQMVKGHGGTAEI